MALPNEKLADSLAVLKQLQRKDGRVFHSGAISRVHRERLVRNGFLREVMKGWLISASPYEQKPREYASFWEFCARYGQARFGHNWHLSPEQSLLLHADNTVVPKQVIVYAKKGKNNATVMPFGVSLYDLKSPMP